VDIGAFRRFSLPLVAAVKAEEISERTAATAEKAGERVAAAAAPLVLSQSFLAAPVVDFPLVRVREGFVGRAQVLEARVRLRIVRIFVRVHFLWEWQHQNLNFGFYVCLLLRAILVINGSRFLKVIRIQNQIFDGH
jgi:hypothetical protein